MHNTLIDYFIRKFSLKSIRLVSNTNIKATISSLVLIFRYIATISATCNHSSASISLRSFHFLMSYSKSYRLIVIYFETSFIFLVAY